MIPRKKKYTDVAPITPRATSHQRFTAVRRVRRRRETPRIMAIPVTNRAEAMMGVLTSCVKGIRRDMRENRTAEAAITGIPVAEEERFISAVRPAQLRFDLST